MIVLCFVVGVVGGVLAGFVIIGLTRWVARYTYKHNMNRIELLVARWRCFWALLNLERNLMTAKNWRQLFLIVFVASLTAADVLMWVLGQYYFGGLLAIILIAIALTEWGVKHLTGKTLSQHFVDELTDVKREAAWTVIGLAELSVLALGAHLLIPKQQEVTHGTLLANCRIWVGITREFECLVLARF